ncbi:MAG: ABC transporter ATP-binding protein [Candidatus Omnitrophica bacterium]|nr:ABC transporter ATP-binding protein [Candidatus Omnitrophota bacterium]
MERLYEIRNVSKIYQVRDSTGRLVKVTAIEAVTFNIYAGETLGLVGESGSGKSTLGKLIIRLLPVSRGQISFLGKDITSLSETGLRPWRKYFQIVFQDPYRSLNPRIRAGEILMEGISGSAREKVTRAYELLEQVGLNRNDFNRWPHQFSGGQRQRLAIARALGPQPKFLVCDEPTSNLDLSIQAQILNLFLRLKKDYSLTYLFISHNLKLIELLSDRIAVLYQGTLVEIGQSDQILKSPGHPYTRALLASSFYQPIKTSLREVTATGCRYACWCPDFQEKCLREKPELREIKRGHSVACFLV